MSLPHSSSVFTLLFSSCFQELFHKNHGLVQSLLMLQTNGGRYIFGKGPENHCIRHRNLIENESTRVATVSLAMFLVFVNLAFQKKQLSSSSSSTPGISGSIYSVDTSLSTSATTSSSLVSQTKASKANSCECNEPLCWDTTVPMVSLTVPNGPKLFFYTFLMNGLTLSVKFPTILAATL